jgi:hypothetical protein
MESHVEQSSSSSFEILTMDDLLLLLPLAPFFSIQKTYKLETP